MIYRLGVKQCATAMKANDFLIALGCPSYSSNEGIFTLIRLQDMYEIMAFKGNANQALLVGEKIELMTKTSFNRQEIILFSS
jgi:hypothetical protein